MKILSKKTELLKLIKREKNIGFVPTMGAIHKGHVSLIKKSIKQCKKTIVSIFVNKPQFNKRSDYKKYPRNLKKDLSILKKLHINCIYTPKYKDLYPTGPNKKIEINSFSKLLCGKNRPGHFESVVDVIERFVKIIKPAKLYLGEKDMQQLILIKDYLRKHYKKVNVIGCKTIRETNGLAYSSRNLLLNKNEKKLAIRVVNLINKNKKKILNKNDTLYDLKKEIRSMGVKKIDYLKLININRNNLSSKKNKNYRIFISYYLGSTRLIDNI